MHWSCKKYNNKHSFILYLLSKGHSGLFWVTNPFRNSFSGTEHYELTRWSTQTMPQNTEKTDAPLFNSIVRIPDENTNEFLSRWSSGTFWNSKTIGTGIRKQRKEGKVFWSRSIYHHIITPQTRSAIQQNGARFCFGINFSDPPWVSAWNNIWVLPWNISSCTSFLSQRLIILYRKNKTINSSQFSINSDWPV